MIALQSEYIRVIGAEVAQANGHTYFVRALGLLLRPKTLTADAQKIAPELIKWRIEEALMAVRPLQSLDNEKGRMARQLVYEYAEDIIS